MQALKLNKFLESFENLETEEKEYALGIINRKMITVRWDKGFKKSYKKKISNSPLLKRNFWNAMNLFIDNPFEKSLKTHKLSGGLKDSWAFSINYQYRVIFEFFDDKTIVLMDIGTHDEVY